MKTLTYYSSNTNDSQTFNEITAAYGSSLERLDKSLLTWLIHEAASECWDHQGDFPDMNTALFFERRLERLSPDGLLAILQTAIDQLKSDRPE